MEKRESIIITTILAIFMAGIFSILAIRMDNKSTANLMLDMIKYGDAPNEYTIEVKNWEKSYVDGGSTEHFTLYETLTRNKEHSKYIVVMSDNSRDTKSAFVVSNINDIDNTSKRVTHDSTFAPTVRK